MSEQASLDRWLGMAFTLVAALTPGEVHLPFRILNLGDSLA